MSLGANDVVRADFFSLEKQKARQILADLSGCLAIARPTSLVVRRKLRLQQSC
jgi:hypothetical protein